MQPIENSRRVRSNPLVLPLIIAISVALRVAAAIVLGDQVIDLPGTADQVSYHHLALRVLNGDGFSFETNWWPATLAGSPTAHWSFLYTFYLVVVYAIFDVHPLAARIIQAAIVGILHPYLAYWIGKKCFGVGTGLFSAAITGGYAYFIYYAACLMTEPFYIVVIMGIIALSFSIVRPAKPNPGYEWFKFEWLGILFGCVVLLRQLFLILIPFIVIWIFGSIRRTKIFRTFFQFLLTGMILLAMILPFTLYNYTRFGRFVLLNTNSGYAFFFGNHPIYGTQFVPILTEEMGSYQQLIPHELLVLDEAALDQELLKRGLQFVVNDPIRYILLSLSRIPEYFKFWPSAESGFTSNISRVASFGIFLPFMVYGFFLAAKRRKFSRFSNLEWLLLMMMLIYSGIHILTWTLVRYRLPVDAIAIIFAGLAFNHINQKIWFRTRKTIKRGRTARITTKIPT